jgi:TatA/E family protein of Tat protein translocase
MFSGIGGSEVLLVLLVVLILFGSKRIPEFARTMGKATREVRKALNQIRDEVDTASRIDPPEGDAPKGG